MSEQVSGTHGPREDDAIKRQDRSELQAHGEEWPEPESSLPWPESFDPWPESSEPSCPEPVLPP